MWAASGSEAIQKALWAALARDRTRDDDPRHALRLPRQEGPRRRRHRQRDRPRARPARPLHQLPDGRVRRRRACATSRSTRPRTAANWRRCYHQFGRQLGALITEPYLGGGGSYHPPAAYLQTAPGVLPRARPRVHPRRGAGELRPHRRPVRVRDLRPRAGHRRAGQGAGQRRAGGGGGRAGPTCSAALDYGEGVRHLERQPAVLRRRAGHARRVRRPRRARRTAGESSARDRGGAGAAEGAAVRRATSAARRAAWSGASRCATTPAGPRRTGPTPSSWPATRATGGDGIHLLGPLAKKVVRIAPPLVITRGGGADSMELMHRSLESLLSPVSAAG